MILEQIIADSWGVPVDHPKVKLCIAAMLKARVVDSKRLQTIELHRKIDDLRGQGVSAIAIAERFGMTRDGVHKIIKAQLMIRRAG